MRSLTAFVCGLTALRITGCAGPEPLVLTPALAAKQAQLAQEDADKQAAVRQADSDHRAAIKAAVAACGAGDCKRVLDFCEHDASVDTPLGRIRLYSDRPHYETEENAACTDGLIAASKTSPDAALAAFRTEAPVDHRAFLALTSWKAFAAGDAAVKANDLVCHGLTSATWALDDDLLNGTAYELLEARLSACDALIQILGEGGGAYARGVPVAKDARGALDADIERCRLQNVEDPAAVCDASFAEITLPTLDPALAGPILRARCATAQPAAFDSGARACVALASLEMKTKPTPKSFEDALALLERSCTLDVHRCDTGSADGMGVVGPSFQLPPALGAKLAAWLYARRTASDVRGASLYVGALLGGRGMRKDPARARTIGKELCDMTEAAGSGASCMAYAWTLSEPERTSANTLAQARVIAEAQAEQQQLAALRDPQRLRHDAHVAADSAAAQAQTAGETAEHNRREARYQRETAAAAQAAGDAVIEAARARSEAAQAQADSEKAARDQAALQGLASQVQSFRGPAGSIAGGAAAPAVTRRPPPQQRAPIARPAGVIDAPPPPAPTCAPLHASCSSPSQCCGGTMLGNRGNYCTNGTCCVMELGHCSVTEDCCNAGLTVNDVCGTQNLCCRPTGVPSNSDGSVCCNGGDPRTGCR